MAASKTGLGKGLDALLRNVNESASDGDIKTLPVTDIEPNPHQPRKEFHESSLKELAESISAQGVLQPVLVRPRPGGGYELIAGERRWRATQIAGLREIPVIIKNLNDDESLTIAIIENLQREDLNAIDEALGLKQLQQRLEMSQEALAKKIGKSRPAVANALRLLQLPEFIQNDIRDGILSAGHARSLLALDSDDAREELRKRIIDQELSVREAEAFVSFYKEHQAYPELGQALVKSTSKKTKKQAVPKDEEMVRLESNLSESLDTTVKVKGNKDKGQVVIHFTTAAELERLLSILT